MENLYEYNGRIQTRRTRSTPASRIAAKARYWDFINETFDSWMEWEDTPEEMTYHICTCAFTIMFPSFMGLEIEREVSLTYRLLEKQLPERYLQIYADSYCNFVISRLRPEFKPR